MSADITGRSLFIVDNSVSGWTGLRYLKQWAGISRAFDIAGFFEIGAPLELDGEWQWLNHIRLLMGAETSQRMRRALLDSVREPAVVALDLSLELDKHANPFPRGVPAVLAALRQGKIKCRIYGLTRVTLKLANPDYRPIVLTPEDDGDLRMIAEFLEVLRNDT